MGLWAEAVAEPEVSVDVPLLGQRVLQLLAELAHVDVHRAVVAAVGALPDGRVQLRPADDPSGSSCEGSEEFKLARRQDERPAMCQGCELARADLQITGSNGLVDQGDLHAQRWCRQPPQIRLSVRNQRVNKL